MKKTAIIIGAGPAGLTAAWELLQGDSQIMPLVLEATDRVGGIACTISHHGNRIDIGGHRFFSKSDVVMDWWAARMPAQGAPASDDLQLGREQAWQAGGPDPEQEERVMLIRNRISRIYYLRRFFDYPVSLNLGTITGLGLVRTLHAGLGYCWSRLRPRRQEHSLEDFLINRFGAPLYHMFFEDYTEKVWGTHPRQISPAWGAQRIKGLSLTGVLLEALRRLTPGRATGDIRQKDRETSLIEKFLYPKRGPGQLWEFVAADIRALGGDIRLRQRVVGIELAAGRVSAVITECDGVETRLPCDYCLSSMPVKDLVAGLRGEAVPEPVRRIAAGLPYRDFITAGVLVRQLRIRNTTAIPTPGNIVPDTWIYIQEPEVRLCRLQVFNNWSPYMVADPEHTIWLGLEYMCNEGDALWQMDEAAFCAFAVEELVRIGLVDAADVLDSCRIRIDKAYPAYFGTYGEFDTLRGYLDGISNLYCVGRNGQHRYNNQDHSMLTAMEAVRCMRAGEGSRGELWSINTEAEYHESRSA